MRKVTSQMTVQESSPLSDDGGRDYHYSLLNYASEGNLPKVQQTVEKILASSKNGYDSVCKGDYDARTALHLACSEGRLQVVKYFIESGFFREILVKDRWNNTPLDDAIRIKNQAIVNYLNSKLKT